MDSGGKLLRNVEVSSLSCLSSYTYCLFLATLYVGSLYIWKPQYHSTHPSTMKRRFISIFLVSLISPKFVQYFISDDLLKDNSLWRILGIRLDGIIPAILLPVILTAILFMGPLSMEAYSGLWNIYIEPWYWLTYMKELIWLRNYVVAPISEELTFRACMLALIIHCTKPMTAVFICPIFFGAAHLHHLIEQIRFGAPWKAAIATSCFQFAYTSIFGAYSAYLFLRTGHLIAPVLVHSFCNHMGFPDFVALQGMQPSARRVCVACFIFGVILWAILVEPMTEPSLYYNTLPWNTNI